MSEYGSIVVAVGIPGQEDFYSANNALSFPEKGTDAVIAALERALDTARVMKLQGKEPAPAETSNLLDHVVAPTSMWEKMWK